MDMRTFEERQLEWFLKNQIDESFFILGGVADDRRMDIKNCVREGIKKAVENYLGANDSCQTIYSADFFDFSEYKGTKKEIVEKISVIHGLEFVDEFADEVAKRYVLFLFNESADALKKSRKKKIILY